MTRDINDPRIVNVLGTFAVWQTNDGETFDPTVVESFAESLNLSGRRAEVVQAVAEAYLRTCDEESLDRLDAWAAEERETKAEIEREALARDALVALGMPLVDADRLIDDLGRRRAAQEVAVQ
jgi:hypothetical protein